MIGTEKVLGTKSAMATIAVKDLAAAREFYEHTLGLTPTESRESEVAGFRSGQSVILVYRSQFAGTNRATAATWAVGEDLSGVVQALRAKGVHFEHYDMPGMQREGDVHIAGTTKAAWFKDPDGNILSLVNG
jgi:catechol 2,3-dioxygenase-like lactoylglutathione lyase family enzyme